ncbi:cytochrome c peroxidase [Arsenicibacter rosenii]|uniref:Cytochrome c domain-containing protein n=1 Tax=Arsenicibacter rosenii TaxID=1750698 RepID=A0A1S2VFM9_9BACT|nr:cytochrome c peroxidase [Arsenicibacter rosenii]OIN57016.1 hypothetical protein BLX24_21950 [Arsenicibacter rosenii]
MTSRLSLLILLLASLPAWRPPADLAPGQTIRAMYVADVVALDSATAGLYRAVSGGKSPGGIRQRFRQARLAYKRIEWLTEALYPYSARRLNGPPVPEGELEGGVGQQINPEGFQVIEETLFPYDPGEKTAVLTQLTRIRQTIRLLWQVSTSVQLTDSKVFDAMRLQLFRIITLGISGFDSPVDRQSLPEASVSMQALRRVLAHYPVAEADPALAGKLDRLFAKAGRLLRRSSFEGFDRLVFIRTVANPLGEALAETQQKLHIPVLTGRRMLAASARTLSDSGIFDPYVFAPVGSPKPTPDRIALGKMLFSGTLLSDNARPLTRRSCAGCHQPERAFTDGQTTALVLGSAHDRIRRNTPTLLQAGLQVFQFLDARSLTIEEQIHDVLNNPREMGGSWPAALNAIQADAAVMAAFRRAYGGLAVSRETISNAIAHYVRSLTGFNTRFDRYMRCDPATQLTTEEQQGFNLFMGKAKCGTCHFYPIFNGTVPPDYTRTESEVIGVPATADNRSVSPDSGRYGVTRLAIHLRAFKIPGIREAANTAPYMHNGVYPTLEQVIDFYDKGGGNGLGFGLPNQTLPDQKLSLTPHEKRALIAFLRTL